MSNRIIKDTIAITVITLVAGLALGVVQDITACLLYTSPSPRDA